VRISDLGLFAATTPASAGASIEEIMKRGGWKSARYPKIPTRRARIAREV
jgi:hypothetical protein